MDAITVKSINEMPLGTVASNKISCGSSNSSSGYASATNTPTNPTSIGNNNSHIRYSESHSTTPVGMVEPTPVATIAAVTPYYNETFQQQQQQLQQYYSHLQQDHPSHSYQLTDPLLQPSAPQDKSTCDSCAFLAGNDNPQSTNIERNFLGMRHPTTFYTELEKSSKIPMQPATQHHNKTTNSHINHIYNSETGLYNSKRSSEASTYVKPQATATPFYAQPSQTSSSMVYFDPYKNKLSTKLAKYNIDYSDKPLEATNEAPYAQNFQQNYGGNTFQGAVYGGSSSQRNPLTAVTNAREPQQRLGMPFGNTAMAVGINIGTTSNSSNVGATYFDKYLYTVVTTAAQSPFYTSTQPANLSAVPPQYASEIRNDTYHKTSTSSSWHWSMEYSNGNYRSPSRYSNAIPTATIPPTNASYVSPNTAVAPSRDIYYTPEKYSNKYDKYNSYYNPHQQYMTTNAVGHTFWPNSPHSTPYLVPALNDSLSHAYSHHASLPPTGVPTAIAPAPTHPSLAYHHPFPPSAASVTDRQSCCSQPYQQQNCYYPRNAQHPHHLPNVYSSHTQTASGNSNNNTAGKYGMLDYGHDTKAKVNTNDIYARTTPTYETTNINYHSYPVGITHNQQYENPITPATVVSHQPLNPNITPHSDISTVYYNDLNMQTAYDTYISPVQVPALLQRCESLVQRVEQLPNLPPPYIQSTPVKSSLTDFRKPPEIVDENCFIAETTRTNINDHLTTDMSNSASNFRHESGMRLSNAIIYSQKTAEESADKTGTPLTPTTKIYSSLRDFLSTWNEDEEDFEFTDERKLSDTPHFDEQIIGTEGKTNLAKISNKMLCVSGLPSVANTPVSITLDSEEISRTPQQPSNTSASNTRSKTHDDVNVGRSTDVETNRNVSISLPDIIIDIERSSSSTPAFSSAAKVFKVDMNMKSKSEDIHYNNFDVEKEIDELKTKRVQLSRKNPNIPPPCTGGVIMRTETEAKEIQTKTMPQSFIEDENDKLESMKTSKSFELISNSSYTAATEKLEENINSSVNKSELTLSTVQTKPDVSCDRGIESDYTTISNGSTFEREYKTFINKIGNNFDLNVAVSNESNIGTINMANKLTDSGTILENRMTKTFAKRNPQTDIDIIHKLKSFSKFYKRKYSDLIKYEGGNKLRNQGQILVSDLNFAVVSTKPCRKGKGKQIHLKPSKYSFYQRTLRSLRRHLIIRGKRLDSTLLLQQHIAPVAESPLPVIMRKVAKQFSSRAENQFKFFNPKTLKCLTICLINSEIFRIKLLNRANFKKDITEPKIMNTAPKKEIEIPNEMLKAISDIPPPNQAQVIENNEECKKSADIFAESSLNEQLLYGIKTAENCTYLNSLRHFVAENAPSKDIVVEGIESKKTEIFDVENKNFIESTKVLDGPPYEIPPSSQNMEVLKEQIFETEKVGEERTGTSNFNTDNGNRVKRTKLQLSEDETEKSCAHSEQSKTIEIGFVTVQLKKTSNTSVEMAMHNFENREPTLDIVFPSKDEKIRLNSSGENVYRIVEDHLHSERVKHPQTEMNIEKNEQSVRADSPGITRNCELCDEQSERLTNLDVYEMENSVEMFRAKKFVEYFPESPRHYFEKSVDFDDKSPDCYSSGSSDSSATSCGHKLKILSSSSSYLSSDEDTKSNTGTTYSDSNEMKESEKELSQRQASESSNNFQAIAKEKHIDADFYTQDGSRDKRYDVPVRTITENDIKTLKQTLGRGSDEHEQEETSLKKTDQNVYEDERYAHASINTNVSEDNEYHDGYKTTEDNEPMQAEESVVFNDESNLEVPVNVKDSLGYEVGNVFVETSRLERCDKSCEMECLETGLEIGEIQSQIKYLFNASLGASKENRVPSLKQILLDFLERENSIEYDSKIHRTEDDINSRIPKLSDLCKIALCSSFEISATSNTIQNVPEKLERELSVEEALAEMYRQAGVALDPEDGDEEEKEDRDCDMNENALSVVAHAQEVDLPMAVHDDEDNIAVRDENDEAVKDVARLENCLQEVKLTYETTDLFGPYSTTDAGMPHLLNEAEMSYTTLTRTVPTEITEDAMIFDNEHPIHMDSLEPQFYFPAIHHEEIVSHDYRRLKRQILYSSLREKYVLKRVNFRAHYGNRLLKKYIHRWILQCLIARFRERELKKVQI
ncbi:PREDICTED: uncharacterized protein LOC108368721 [Rhagoletis zephyria]|uniref:uncharacterized protein LOC108368721 n=1 Tax=Rhagoletis zephyria TaxID=28612 RepID=UPI0008119C61|nr:PREDICTED: uncharacterized protein LOC108368721 [Rhagoletis zephyria]